MLSLIRVEKEKHVEQNKGNRVMLGPVFYPYFLLFGCTLNHFHA